MTAPNPAPQGLARFNYTSNDGETITIRMNEAIGQAVGNTPTDDPVTFSVRHNKLRHLNLKYQSDPNAKVYRKRVVVGDVTNDHWVNGTPVTINNTTWEVTSRSEERGG